MELNKFEVLEGKARTRHHSITVTSASVCTRTAEVGSSIASSCKDGLVGAETMQSTIFHIESDDTDAFAILHNEVEGEVLDKEVRIVAERLAVERVEKGVTRSVSGSCTPICLTTLAELQRLATESTLVDLALLGSRERNTEMFKLK